MSDYYWYEGKKVLLQSSATYRAARLSSPQSRDSRRSIAAAIGARSEKSTGIDLGNGIVLFEINTQAPRSAAAALPSDTNLLSVFTAPDSTSMILTEEFNVQFKPEVTRDEIDKFNTKNKVKIVSESQWERNTFVLAVLENIAGTNALTMANLYHDSGLVNYAQPNFLRLMKPAYTPTNPLFPQQWALRNTGQGGGVAGQDIHVVDAWDISRGSTGVTIAIIDEGVDYTHPDLNTPGKLVTGYDAIKRVNDPNPSNDDAHGTACAGIAAAGSNGTGISGIAPNCRIMGIRIAYGAGGNWVTSDAQIADGINTAVARGADVLSNSWGGGSPSTAITNAIRNAKTTGRSGRGCIVCFAAGNNNGAVSYPGNLPEVITVAACNEWGEPKSPTSRDGETWWGSNFGPEVDVSAPGVHITTTDISGSRGYNPSGNYVTTFNGTSAATPHVAGVAALILSANPNLTAAEVEAILRSSTDDVGQQGYDIYSGFGRINAFKAVKATQFYWDSPRMIPGLFGAENQGGDIAVADISRNGRTDLLVFQIDHPGGENHGYYRIGWDLDNFGIAQSWSSIKTVPGGFGAETQGAGVALADIKGNGLIDLLVFHIDNPSGNNHGYYRIGWNLNPSGDPTGGWSPIKPAPGWFGAENQGAGVALADINGNGSQDLIIFNIGNPSGENYGYYRIGWNLDKNGDVMGGWSDFKTIPGSLGPENQGGGIAVADLNGDGRPELIVFYIDNPVGENRGYYRIGWNLDKNGDVKGGWSQIKAIPGWFGKENQGGGVAVSDIDGNGRKDLLIYHIDNPAGENHGYYRIGWNLSL